MVDLQRAQHGRDDDGLVVGVSRFGFDDDPIAGHPELHQGVAHALTARHVGIVEMDAASGADDPRRISRAEHA